jgi:hypothetical protein
MSKRWPDAPQIGFDRFIPLAWAGLALDVRRGVAAPEALAALLASEEPGLASRKKTRSILRGLWLEPRPELADFATRGVEIAQGGNRAHTAALCWGMAVAAYPFFGKVAEVIGRLSALQGDCTTAEVHRRIAEIHGQRETAHRAANRVFQTQADWLALEPMGQRLDRGRRLARRAALPIAQDALRIWLVEAAARYAGKPLPVAALQTLPVLYPFQLGGSLGYLASRTPAVQLISEGPSTQYVATR